MGANKEITTGSIFVVDAKHMWLDDETVASNMAYNTKYFQENVSCLPNFPRPRIINNRRRWNWAEISDWINRQTDEPSKKIGRPRKA